MRLHQFIEEVARLFRPYWEPTIGPPMLNRDNSKVGNGGQDLGAVSIRV